MLAYQSIVDWFKGIGSDTTKSVETLSKPRLTDNIVIRRKYSVKILYRVVDTDVTIIYRSVLTNGTASYERYYIRDDIEACKIVFKLLIENVKPSRTEQHEVINVFITSV
jgi:hypothetical protein